MPGRRDVPLRPTSGPARCPPSAAILRPALEKISARIAVSEYSRGTLVSHVGGEPVVIPNGLYVDRFASAAAAAGVARRQGTSSRSSAGSASRARASPLLPRRSAGSAARPARAAAAGRRRRGRRRGARAAARRRPRPGDLPRAGLRRGQGRRAAHRRRVRRARTPAARASGSCWSRRWPPARRCWPATCRPSARVLDDGALRRAVPHRGRRRPGREAGRRCSTTRRDAARSTRPPGPPYAATTGPSVAGQILRVYETVVAGGVR